MWKRPVFIASSPNTTWADAWLGLRLLLQPWKWRRHQYCQGLRADFASYQGIKPEEVFLLDSGRSSLYFMLKTLGIGAGDEVIVPAFTCLAVANPIRWTGATPIYVDTDAESFNMNLDLLPNKITPRTKAIIAQHTFGKPVDMQELQSIIAGKNILIIEDCAHSLGGTIAGKKLGTIGDAAIYAFGIDKVISGVRAGGMSIDFAKAGAKGFTASSELFEEGYDKLKEFPLRMTWRALLNPFLWQLAAPLYFVGIGPFTIGRMLIRLLFILGIIGNVVSSDENVGDMPGWMPSRISPALARLTRFQLARIDQMNQHRVSLSRDYAQRLGHEFDPSNQVYLKYSFLLADTAARNQLYQRAKAHGILIGNWLPRPLYAKFSSTDVYPRLCYRPEESPVAENVASRIVNLPTSINMPASRVGELCRLVSH